MAVHSSPIKNLRDRIYSEAVPLTDMLEEKKMEEETSNQTEVDEVKIKFHESLLNRLEKRNYIRKLILGQNYDEAKENLHDVFKESKDLSVFASIECLRFLKILEKQDDDLSIEFLQTTLCKYAECLVPILKENGEVFFE